MGVYQSGRALTSRILVPLPPASRLLTSKYLFGGKVSAFDQRSFVDGIID